MSERADIMQFDLAGLSSLMVEMGQKSYRGQQLAEWLYIRGADSFAAMNNLPPALRVALAERYRFSPLRLLERTQSRDGTVRYLLELGDGALTETVAIATDERLTVCFSTQVGCALGCVFCATGSLGFSRQLLTGEMLAQISFVAADFADRRISNVVAMGQGEPFANYEATLGALRMLNYPALFGIGARHITLSTAGLVSQIQRFALEPEQFTLAVSLHSAQQHIRDLLMPGLHKQLLGDLQAALVAYMEETSRRVSLEYMLIAGVNDGPDAIASLLAFCAVPVPGFHVNLLSLNPTEVLAASPLKLARAGKSSYLYFERALKDAGISVSRRLSRGAAINAACGQLSRQRQTGNS